jgi:hypothetical protein
MKRFALFALALALPAATASAQDYFVTLTGSDANTGAITSPWRTVTHAAANAPSGARILVGPGTYGTAGNLEGIEVSGGKKLTILGAGRSQTVIQAHAGFSPTIPVRNYTRSWTTVLAAHGAGTRVDLRALTLDANHLSSANLLSAAVYTDGASGRLDEVDLLGAGAMTPNDAQGHMGFAAIGRDSLTPSQVWLFRCRVSGWNKTGIYLGGFGLSADVSQSEVIGAGVLAAGQAAQNGIQLEEGATYTLINNTIRDVWYQPSSFNACAVLAFDTRGTVELRANRIFNSKTAIYYQSALGVSASVMGKHHRQLPLGSERRDGWCDGAAQSLRLALRRLCARPLGREPGQEPVQRFPQQPGLPDALRHGWQHGQRGLQRRDGLPRLQ